MLQDAGMNLDENITEEQRQMLALADYYDHLNLKYAYFPPKGANTNESLRMARHAVQMDNDADAAAHNPQANIEDGD